jgi:hypothetical protein
MPEIPLLKRQNFSLGVEAYIINFPPYHPSMAKDGIDLKLAASAPVMDQAIAATLEDMGRFEGIYLEMLKGFCGWKAEKKENGVLVAPLPTSLCQLLIQKDKISPYGGDHYISIGSGNRQEQVIVEGDLSDQVKKEYDLSQKTKIQGGKMTFTSPNLWGYNNLFSNDIIFYRNLLVALNNAVVKAKYTKKVEAKNSEKK